MSKCWVFLYFLFTALLYLFVDFFCVFLSISLFCFFNTSCVQFGFHCLPVSPVIPVPQFTTHTCSLYALIKAVTSCLITPGLLELIVLWVQIYTSVSYSVSLLVPSIFLLPYVIYYVCQFFFVHMVSVYHVSFFIYYFLCLIKPFFSLIHCEFVSLGRNYNNPDILFWKCWWKSQYYHINATHHYKEITTLAIQFVLRVNKLLSRSLTLLSEY